MEQPIVCIITADPRWKRELERVLEGSFTLSFIRDFKEATSFVKKQLIGCIIVPGSMNKTEDLVPIETFQHHFPEIPLVVYGKVAGKELAHQLGRLGVEFVDAEEVEKLLEQIQPVIEQRSFHFDFKEFGIMVEQCPIMIKKALKIIEKDFLKLSTVTEIAVRLRISRCYLEKQFTDNCKITCKRLLLALKLYYATFLMETTCLSIKEIAQQCNFFDPFAFYRLFTKMVGLSASEYRRTKGSKEFPEMVIKNIKKKN